MLHGRNDEKLRASLDLRRHMCHGFPHELRRVPVKMLTMVEDPRKSCETCHRWETTGTRPNLKGDLSKGCNQHAWIDLIFARDVSNLMVDNAIRYTVLKVVCF